MLNLYYTDFTGQSEPEFCGGTTSTAFHSLSVSDRHAPANQQSRPVEVTRSSVLSEPDWYDLLFGHGHHEAPLLFVLGGFEPTTALMPILLLALEPLG